MSKCPGGAGVRQRRATASLAERRRIGQQPARIRTLRRIENGVSRALFLDPATLEDNQPIGAIGRDPKIMRYEQHGGVVLGAQGVDQIEDAFLHGDVERAGRLVGDDQCRLQGNGDRDQHALPHASRQFMRILRRPPCRIRQPDFFQKFDYARPDVAALMVNAQNLRYLRADALHGIERAGWVLRDQADLRAADCVEPFLRPFGNIGAVQPDGATIEPAIAGQQPYRRLCGGGFAGPGFADQGDDLAAIDVEGDFVHHALPRFALERRKCETFDHRIATCTARS